MKNMMKLMLTCVLACSFSFVRAQYPAKDTMKNKPMPAQSNPMGSKDYVMMKNGAMVAYKSGKESNLLTTYQCSNGDKVSATGVVTMSDGTTRTLKEGDKVFQDGRLEAAKSNPQKSQQNPPK